MRTGQRIMQFSASGRMTIGIVVFAAGYIPLAGMLTGAPVGLFPLLHRFPVVAAAGILIVNLLLRMTRAGLGRRQGAAEAAAMPLLLSVGLFLVAVGVIVSSLTRFHGTLAVAEGQGTGSAGMGFQQETLYRRPFAAQPDMEVTVLQIRPFIPGQDFSTGRVHARLLVRGRSASSPQNVPLSWWVPSLVDGMFMWIHDVQYAPRYEIFDAGGTVVDEAYTLLRLFPPGTEDSFTVYPMPYTFYVQYEPQGKLSGKRTPTAEKRGHRYRIRVTRNMDILAPTKSINPGERLQFSSESIALADGVPWIEIRVVRDPGLYCIMPGMLMIIIAGIAKILERKRPPALPGKKDGE